MRSSSGAPCRELHPLPPECLRVERFGGLPRTCLYDNTKVVVLGRDAAGVPHWNATFLDFALRVGFEARLCRPYRPQTKGRVEERRQVREAQLLAGGGIVDGVDLNHQAHAWMDGVANVRVHGTTGERPLEQLGSPKPPRCSTSSTSGSSRRSTSARCGNSPY